MAAAHLSTSIAIAGLFVWTSDSRRLREQVKQGMAFGLTVATVATIAAVATVAAVATCWPDTSVGFSSWGMRSMSPAQPPV